MPEEVVLLVEKQLAVLIDDPHAHHRPLSSQLEKWNAERIGGIQAQIAASEVKEAQDQAASRSMSEAAIRKRKEREEKRAAAARAKALAEGNDPNSAAESIFTPTPTPSSQTPNTQSPNTHVLSGTVGIAPHAVYTVTVPGSSAAELEWYSSHGCAYSTIEDAKAAGIWSYPTNLFERAKCGVFQDLWESGHFMGGGIKFGGDFLVYPGDPLRYHSHFVASVIESPIATLKPMEIVAHGRLGTATKKAHLLCGWDDEKREVSYYSIEWAGFG
ncbi:hypothetical protein PHLCEN_2v3018 [Hermanssonia centrifuga]|uniref:tRNA-splicing endonuclease subunit Sen34 n=1 Tax=Hermanssonia centrifuga TaxID=98765 RepID=A0A2R6R7D7_9APHY|nr:hypothetical protein PHLCEN_2v3018 [Hermanssonia centrifuga]